MTLSQVEYEFFEYEDPSSTATELDRQIKLRFSDASVLYVSWTSGRQHGPDDQPYSIGFRDFSYCSAEPAFVVDASNSPMWSKHIGRTLELAYTPASAVELGFQVLELRSGTNCIFLSSLGTDSIRISDAAPNP